MQLTNIEGIKVIARKSASGANLGQRLAFIDKGTPSQMREEFKRAGMKGNALSKAVREAVKNGKDIAWVRFQALTQMAQSGGFVPVQSDLNKGGDKIKMELVLPKEPKRAAKGNSAPATPTPEQVQAAAVELIAKSQGVSVEDARKILGL
jgi:hypothetical protein